MRLRILAIGRLRKGPEVELFKDYVTRFDRTGRPLALGPIDIVELEDRKGGGSNAEGQLLLKAIPDGAYIVAMDERGKVISSPQFAKKLAQVRDDGVQDFCLIIGGADGLSQEVRNRADMMLSFGDMVWPHMLVRVMLTEQLYRAASILAGSPYHRI